MSLKGAIGKHLRTNKEIFIVAFIIVLFGTTAWFVYSWNFQMLPQDTIYLLDDIPNPRAGQRILVFAPHPDDETVGAGGYIIRAENVKARVWIVLVTDGNKHGLANKRYAEFRNAAAILGVPESNLFYLGYPDGKLKKQNWNEVREKFKNIVENVKPDTVLLPSPYDRHPDHAVTGKIAFSILRKEKATIYDYLVHYPRFPRPEGLHPSAYMLPPVKMVSYDKEWRRLILTPAEEARKLKAVLQYKTQSRYVVPGKLLQGMVRKNELYAVPERNGG